MLNSFVVKTFVCLTNYFLKGKWIEKTSPQYRYIVGKGKIISKRYTGRDLQLG